MDMLLFSNSMLPGAPYLAYAYPVINAALRQRRKVTFIPFAGVTTDWDAYTDKVSEELAALKLTIVGRIRWRQSQRRTS